ncbi:Penicillin-binding protein 4 precursor [Rickettsiales bacterium Ac37b]|nr:Penicillin-binding protein 4 precursor [Rickettsiales bacterium Ac37b]
MSSPSKSNKKLLAKTPNLLKHKTTKPRFMLFNIFKHLCKWTLIIMIWCLTITASILLYYSHDLPDLTKLEQLQKQRSITLLNTNNEILARFGDLYGNYLDFQHIPKVLIQAVLATEDRRFFYHPGIDVIGLIRATYANYKAGYVVQGGSTITQQLAKIIFLTPERTIKRKIQELVLALILERKFTKQQILAIYLNRVYLGSGIYGVDAAAKYYFGKEISQINLYEAAIIAGLLKAPSRYTPIKNIELSGKRAFQILLNMKEAGFITDNDIKATKHTVVLLNTSALGRLKNLYFATWIVDQINNFTNDIESDLIIKTTLDLKLEQYAEEAVQKIIKLHGHKYNTTEASMVVLSKHGEVLAMVGGTNYHSSPFNRAVQAQRQAGSAFKLFVYAAALENGYNTKSIISDSPITINKWQPKNYTRQYLGEITLEESFARSINTASVKLSESIGRTKVISFAHKLGITSYIHSHPSLALGSVEVNLLELTSAFATIPNNGYALWPYGIKSIYTQNGRILYKRQISTPTRIMNTQTVLDLKNLLRSAVSTGTGKSAQLEERAAYGKTGTTQDYRDAWFIGFAGDLTAGVWVGNDNNQPMKKVTGGTLPAYIWKEFMNNALGSNTIIDLQTLKEIYQEDSLP